MIYHLSSNTHNNAPAQKYENYLPHFIQLLNKHKNSKIVVFGMGFSAPIADYISQRLTLNGFCTMSVVHMEMLDASFQDSTFLIEELQQDLKKSLKQLKTIILISLLSQVMKNQK